MASRGVTHLIKDILELELCQGTALDVLNGAQFLGHPLAILLPDRRHLLLRKFLANTRVIAKIDLSANDQARHARAMVVDLREPLLANVLE